MPSDASVGDGLGQLPGSVNMAYALTSNKSAYRNHFVAKCQQITKAASKCKCQLAWLFITDQSMCINIPSQYFVSKSDQTWDVSTMATSDWKYSVVWLCNVYSWSTNRIFAALMPHFFSHVFPAFKHSLLQNLREAAHVLFSRQCFTHFSASSEHDSRHEW